MVFDGEMAEMALIELVDFNDVKPEGSKTTKKKRTRRAGKSTSKPSQIAEVEVASKNEGASSPAVEEKPE